MFFHFENLRFLYDPFPIGSARPAMEEGIYKEILDSWPPTAIFHHHAKVGDKYALSEKFNGRQYRDFVRSRPIWREFHGWIKSDAFTGEVMDTLRRHHMDLGYGVRPPLKRLSKRIKHLARGRLALRPSQLSARFEFQMLPADGGHILPHTDNPTKVVTLVLSVLRDGEWDPAFGGGTDVNRPKDMRFVYNRLNHQGRFEDMEVLHTFEFVPNQLVTFVKTFNSWHSVRPMTGIGSPAMRRTLTINIETPK